MYVHVYVHKFPFKFMAWSGLTFQGRHRHFALKTSIDAALYIKNVLHIVKRDGNRLIELEFTFQQDGAIHTRVEQRSRQLKAWPPNSPDLKTLDYFFFKVQLQTKTFNNLHELAQKIKESFKKNSLKSIHDAIDWFRPRVCEVEKYQGGLIINKYI